MTIANELDKYLLIVNDKNPLTKEREEWLKENFEYVPYKDEDGDSCMEVETYKAYTSLVKLMKTKHKIDVDSHSAWRSIETQQKVYNELAKTYSKEWLDSHVASPGASEHHTGLAFDLRFKLSIVPESLRDSANEIAKRTGLQKKVFKLIEKEALQFGLIKRYSADKKNLTGVNEELWHFRYVGVEHAKAMYESNLCLEEYVRLLESKNESKKVTVR